MADKNDIVNQIVTATGASTADATKWLDAAIAAIRHFLVAGESVTVPGLGTFGMARAIESFGGPHPMSEHREPPNGGPSSGQRHIHFTPDETLSAEVRRLP